MLNQPGNILVRIGIAGAPEVRVSKVSEILRNVVWLLVKENAKWVFTLQQDTENLGISESYCVFVDLEGIYQKLVGLNVLHEYGIRNPFSFISKAFSISKETSNVVFCFFKCLSAY